MERWALRLFPDIAQAYDANFGQAFRKTDRLIRQGAAALYQPSFRTADGRFCRADIIARAPAGAWDLYEVKSSTRPKDEHVLDLAFQRLVMEENGMPVRQSKIIHVNAEYVRRGEIDPSGLLSVADVTEDVEAAMPRVYGSLGPAMAVMAGPDEPAVPVLNQCYRPYECPFVGYCWRDVPADSVHALGLSDGDLAGLLSQGIILAREAPADIVPPRKAGYHQALLSGRPALDREGVRRWLGRLRYPLHHLDYETFASAIPPFDGCRPYQQVPFQYSLHVQDSPGGPVRHFEHLAEGWGDPVPALVRSLRSAIGDGGTVLAWYKAFESGRNEEMAERVPEAAEFFASVNGRMEDLMEPFKEGLYVDARFGGSASLKAVLPALVPDMGYDRLAIGNGGLASARWREMVDRRTDPEESAAIRRDLLEYCGQDTLAMVRILEVLQAAAA